ncbi:hypothetical protein TRFO_36882 [Tritrichomonas foetus]|uniref:Poly A polymerase head domain-containing protein n=1 Tax=Tritrichomonas foetus TaxID=1144522 RepID=A0A1J4JIG5_9EUKA|nr:hypothetical protein TRFO_36882 [Tritrichomonas foetus]|eukprot:OHS96988.1 hypothetical protein TRFO_36882 [Tritrichomonas foetus]
MYISKIPLIESGKIFPSEIMAILTALRETAVSFEKIDNIIVIARAYGGVIRDALEGFPINDIDVVIEGTSIFNFTKKLCDFFPNVIDDYSTIMYDKRKKDCEITLHIGTKFGKIIDIAHCYYNGKPDLLSNIIDRDFTINTIHLNLNEMKIEDFLNGFDDFEKRILRTPRPAEIEYREEPNTIMRAMRFVHKYNLILNDSEKILPEWLQNLEMSWIHDEVKKSLKNGNIRNYFKLLIDHKLFPFIFGDFKWDYQKVLRIEDSFENEKEIYFYLFTECVNDISEVNLNNFLKYGFSQEDINNVQL